MFRKHYHNLTPCWLLSELVSGDNIQNEASMIRKALLSTALATFIGVSSGSLALAQGPGSGAGGQGAGSGGSKAAMFEKCDMNADGRLTKDEFKGCYSARAEKKFTRIDADNDGSISREEAQQWGAQRQGSSGAGPAAGQRGGPSGGSPQ
jgi:EF hand